MHTQDLIRLGFSEKEATVYMALVQFGASPASTLARRTTIKRTSMYDVLNSLLEKNLIRTFTQGTHTYFVIDDINKLTLHEKQRLSLAESLVKNLKETHNLNPGIQVHHYKGIEGYRGMYEHILEICPKEVFGWINLDHFLTAIDPEREKQWTKERTKKNIHARLLMQDSPLAQAFVKDDPKYHRETRLISSQFPFKTSCILYEDTINFFDTIDEVSGIRIHNRELFNMEHQAFEMNWQNSASL